MPRKRNTRIRYDKLVSEGTFLGDYLSYMSNSETPHAYDFWTGCWLLSTAVGRAVHVNRPRAPVYLNLFCILVAESGITRKSTAVREATNYARSLCSSGSPLLITSKVTPEKLDELMVQQTKAEQDAAVSIAISELVTFMGKEKYVEAMPTKLTDLYDCPEVITGGGTLARGSYEIKNVFCSFLSASTPSWLLRAVNPDVIEGGFTSRVVFIVAEKPKGLIPWPTDKSTELRDKLRSHLERIRSESQTIARIEISPGGFKAFSKWYRGRYIHNDTFRSSFQSREDAHILRLAAFLCINDSTWVIQASHVTTAIRIVEEIREDGASIFEGVGAGSAQVILVDRIRDKLLAGGLDGVSQTDLTRGLAGTAKADNVGAVLAVMHELGMVQRFEVVLGGRGRPKTVWRATQGLAQGKALDTVLKGLG